MIIKAFFFWRLGLLLLTYWGSIFLPKNANGALGAVGETKAFDYFKSLAQWDGGHYLTLAQEGYVEAQDFAFFPVFPALARLLGKLLAGNYLLSGLIVANVTFLLFLFVLYNFVKEKFSERIAKFTAITLLVFPTGFFAVSYYSEGLFLLMVAAAFLYLYKNRLLMTAAFISLASLTRSTGVLLILSFAYHYFADISFRLQNINKKLFYILISLAGISAYSLALKLKFNEPFKYISAQSYWLRQADDPFSTLVSYLWGFLTTGRPLNDYLDVSIFVIFIAVLIAGRRKIPSSMWIFSMLSLLIPASFGTLTSMPRYAFASIGTFIIIGDYLASRPRLRIIVWTFSLALQGILAAMFINGYWVA